MASKDTLGKAQSEAATALKQAADANSKLADLQKQFEAVTAEQSLATADLAAAQRERDDARNALASANAKIAELQKPPPAVAPKASPPAALSTARTFRDCPQCPEMVEVPAGSFMIGVAAVRKGP